MTQSRASINRLWLKDSASNEVRSRYRRPYRLLESSVKRWTEPRIRIAETNRWGTLRARRTPVKASKKSSSSTKRAWNDINRATTNSNRKSLDLRMWSRRPPNSLTGSSSNSRKSSKLRKLQTRSRRSPSSRSPPIKIGTRARPKSESWQSGSASTKNSRKRRPSEWSAPEPKRSSRRKMRRRKL